MTEEWLGGPIFQALQSLIEETEKEVKVKQTSSKKIIHIDVPNKQPQRTATAVHIRADYVAKNGAPIAAAPKIFFRYYLVDSSTGVKSQTMLAKCKWSAGLAKPSRPDRSVSNPVVTLRRREDAGWFLM